MFIFFHSVHANLPYGSTPTSSVTIRAVKMDEGEDEEDLNPEDEEWRTQAGNKPVNPSPPPPPANPNPLNEETMDLASESILCV